MLKIDKEFKNLIPPLADDEYKALENSIIKEGCRDAIVVWNDTIVDGHNRYEICTKHNIKYKTLEKKFADRNEVILWMIENQKARRNLTKFALITLESKKSDILALKEKAKENHDTFKGNQHTGAFPTLEKKQAINVAKELAKKTQTSNGTVGKVQALEKKFSAEPKKYEEVRKNLMSGDTSINQAYKEIVRKEKKEAREKEIIKQMSEPSQSIDLKKPPHKYRVIYADPPWQYNDKQNISELGGAEKFYHTMPLKDICKLKVPTENNAVLFLWVTSPMLEDSFEVIKAWGFKYKSSFVWDKVAHNMGHYNSVRHEFLLIAVKGSCTPDNQKLFDSVQSIEREEHSRKPEQFRKIIETLYTKGYKLEMFARGHFEGWDTWGNMT